MNQQKIRLIEAIDQHQEELIELLGKLVAFNTVSPPARNTIPLQEFISQELEQANFDVHQKPFYEKDLLVYGSLKGAKPAERNRLILNGHVDVATVEDQEKWQTDPFELVQQGDWLVGRGVSDMKGAVACFLYLFRLVSRLKLEFSGEICFQSVVGEEAGEAGTKQLLQEHHEADFAIVGDTSNLSFQGQGGVITGWITLESPKTYHDGNRISMVHTGGGLKAASMVEKMAVIIDALQKLERYWGITKTCEGFPPGTNTINPAYVEGGIHPAFVANQARLWITVHFYPNETVDEVIAEIEEHILATAKADPWLKNNLPAFKWGGDSMLEEKGEVFPPLSLDTTHPAMKLLAKNHEAQLQQAPVVNMSTTVTDGGWFDYYGIPAVIYGPGELIQAHSTNEGVSAKQLLDYCKVIGGFLFDWCS
ncbi:acetylornithine deacetylase [Enterococcus florum]|uniref:Acetylornithine deacetylase n=1 Tax=Enterococcus florum TaxID=2480627 RepID=A0A4V0WPR9_9ENTE|nr:acetylornithine deacetylase [Enterococcus florum]GCF94819.1 acetylornithine deacetylase [Enterococcus florum]